MPTPKSVSNDGSYLQAAVNCFKDKSLRCWNLRATTDKQWREIKSYTTDYDRFSDQSNEHSVNFLLLLAAIHGEI